VRVGVFASRISQEDRRFTNASVADDHNLCALERPKN
jgi:hypothetical protein